MRKQNPSSSGRKDAPLHAPVFIADSAALEQAMQRLAHERFVTVDTEFLRENTYWPQLCLVQLAGEKEVFLVDPLAPGLDLAPLRSVLLNPDILKVFHAARQDMEIFLHVFGALPAPVFDTQIAAMVAGFGDQVGYGNLVQALTGHSLGKEHRFSDWAYRPLSKEQLAYAAADVTHLRAVYNALLSRVEASGRASWIEGEMAVLSRPQTYQVDPEKAWERLRPRTSSRRFLAVLKAAAAWREREAQRLDIPRARLVRDESLLEIAASVPLEVAGLSRIRGVSAGFAQSASGEGLLEAIRSGAALPPSQQPQLPERAAQRPPAALVALLRVLLAAICEEHEVAPRLLACSEDLESLALGVQEGCPLLEGWRYELFGRKAQALCRGEIALAIEHGKIIFVERKNT